MRRKEHTAGRNSSITQIQYDLASGPVVLAGADVVATTTNVYDAAGQITSITSVRGGTTFEFFHYAHDNGGNVTAETDMQMGSATTTTYSYDASGQLTGVNSSSYSYNADGDQSASGDLVGTNNELLSDGTYFYTYDANGNLLTKTLTSSGDKCTYGYSATNQLTSAIEKTSGGAVEQSVTYKYDAFGNRIEKDDVASGTTTVQRYAYDGWNPAKPDGVGNENFDICADLNGSSSLTTRYLNGDAVDAHLGRIDGTTSEWYLTDHLGSIRAVVNNSGTVKDSITYDAFGNITSDSAATSTTGPAFRGRYAWTGREIDTETGFQYNRARYYDPHSGRWITQDPMGFDAGDSNLYRYATNRPTDETDPSGKQTPSERREIYDKYYSDWGYELVVPKKDTGHLGGLTPDPDRAYIDATARRKEFERENFNLVYSMKRAEIGFYDEQVAFYKKNLPQQPFSPRAYVDAKQEYFAQEREARNIIEKFGNRPELPKQSHWTDYLPVIGSVRDMFYRFDNGDYLLAAVSAAMAVSDLFLVKGAAMAAGRVALTSLTRIGRVATSTFRPSMTVSQAVATARRAAVPAVCEQLAAAVNAACFVAGTRLLTPGGDKPIESFHPGDPILSRPERDAEGRVEVKIVERTFRRKAQVWEVRAGGKSIRTTAEHPFYVKGKGWLSVKELEVGDMLSSHDGQWVAVEAVTDLKEVDTVYNLRVSDYHTYFVSSQEWGFSVWAHNAECAILVREGERWLLRSAGSEGRVLARGTLDEVIAFAGNNSHNITPLWATANGTRSVAEAESSLGRLALQYRVDNNISTARNVFVVEYELNGATRTVPFSSNGVLHSEQVALNELPREARVLRAYSERTPCTDVRHDCFLQLRNDPRFASMQELQYSYSWQINETANREAISAAMRQLQPRR